MTILVLMGVSGCGKTTVGKILAARLGWAFLEGDSLHPAVNIEKMATGMPLDDADRLPWLRAITARIDDWRRQGISGVVACSALKRSYRDILIGPRRDVRLIYLHGTYEEIDARLAERSGHFMPPTLLDSQFRALEKPTADENPIIVPVFGSPDTIVTQIQEQLR
ncbi:MAG: gluconokinase [Acetobacteraceae bacterium]|nr:gluconokinase [Acetobacteraceae bacterium]MSP29989.1 gluconokinase [Acetobacteraceae bacterium]